MPLLVRIEVLPPACVHICIMDADVITEQLSMRINFKIPSPKIGPLFQIFKYKVRLGIDLVLK